MSSFTLIPAEQTAVAAPQPAPSSQRGSGYPPKKSQKRGGRSGRSQQDYAEMQQAMCVSYYMSNVLLQLYAIFSPLSSPNFSIFPPRSRFSISVFRYAFSAFWAFTQQLLFERRKSSEGCFPPIENGPQDRLYSSGCHLQFQPHETDLLHVRFCVIFIIFCGADLLLFCSVRNGSLLLLALLPCSK